MPYELIRAQEITLRDDDGKEHTYVISKIPAMDAREIYAKYNLSALQLGVMPKLSDYGVNHEMALKLLSFAAVPRKNLPPLTLSTTELINNHCPDFVVSTRLEMAMLEYNWSFYRAGRIQDSLGSLFQKALEHFTKTLIRSLQGSLNQGTPPSVN